ncbi:hypothetical protein OG883_26910 [Streptomyces sp. NBC_01142]|uniref:hypothetical protein n=1 Tax=Streptomyces sp. NBC_01142 TaxID=2975865 RepID=UPI00225A8C6B|nr:hypothetical protein [Streptomyces sp. NBC_01142]MCX4823445.1 hypothetical protein [Streptomyces sp. NBC_01142]
MVQDGGSGGGMSSDERQLRMVNPVMAAMLYDPESMGEFKKRVDKLVLDLNGSPAGPKKIGDDAIDRTQFGGGGNGWVEASGLFNAYDTVITQLKQLSQLLADCMEGMGIAVVASKDGYQGMDDDIRRRMLTIRQRTESKYDYEKDTVAQELARERAKEQAEKNKAQQPSGEAQQPGDTAGVGNTQ